MAGRKKNKRPTPSGLQHDHTVLLLQGGGALGAYQAGVYEGMREHGFAPDWVTGVSIGAINAALIVGNPPDKRVERLREFCDRVPAISTTTFSCSTRATGTPCTSSTPAEALAEVS